MFKQCGSKKSTLIIFCELSEAFSIMNHLSKILSSNCIS